MKCMCAQTRPRFILSSEGVFGGMEFEPMLTPREKSPLPENVPRGGSNPRHRGQRAQALPTELFRPPEETIKQTAKGIRKQTERRQSDRQQRGYEDSEARYWFFFPPVTLVSSPPSPVNGFSQLNNAKINLISTLSNSTAELSLRTKWQTACCM